MNRNYVNVNGFDISDVINNYAKIRDELGELTNEQCVALVEDLSLFMYNETKAFDALMANNLSSFICEHANERWLGLYVNLFQMIATPLVDDSAARQYNVFVVSLMYKTPFGDMLLKSMRHLIKELNAEKSPSTHYMGNHWNTVKNQEVDDWQNVIIANGGFSLSKEA